VFLNLNFIELNVTSVGIHLQGFDKVTPSGRCSGWKERYVGYPDDI
jgi:hypothetical protein